MTTLSQRSLAGGELTPSLHARVDTTKYQTGVKTMRNWLTMRGGGARNRTGSIFRREIYNSAQAARIEPFVFSNSQSYVFEFSDLLVRFMQNGEYIKHSVGTVISITLAAQGVIEITAHGLTNGDRVILTGIGGTTELNSREFIVANTTADTFKIKYPTSGAYVNTTTFGAHTGGGTGFYVYSLVTPWVVADLPALTFAQSADVLTVCHPSYAPREIYRYINIFSEVSFNIRSVANPLPAPSTPSIMTVGGGITHNPAVSGDLAFYKVTLVLKGTLEEGLPSVAVSAPADATVGAPNTILTVSPTLATGNGIFFRFYKSYSLDGAYGFVAQTTSNAGAYKDNGDTPDYARQPPIPTNRFNAAGDYPAAVTYAQQRRLMGGSDNAPERIDGSVISHYNNYTIREPIQDDDAIGWQNSSRRMNRVKHMLNLARLIVFTESGEWIIEGGGSGELTPSSINPKQHSYNGSGIVPPIVVDDNALYVQAQGNIIRDLAFDVQVDGYRGNDITTFATHLFKGKTIVAWDYQKTPDSVVWVVLDDGSVVGCTYVREQQILAWHRHDFDGGFVEDVCCIPEGTKTATYFIVKRTINGATVRYIEQLAEPIVTDIRSAIYMDSALSYDGRNTGSTTMTLSAGTGWTHADTKTCTASVSTFKASNVGDQLFFYDPLTGAEVRFEIVVYTSTTVVTVRPQATPSTALQTLLSAGTTTWSLAVDTVSGLWHLEGEDVSVLGDGFVVANPYRDEIPLVTVTNGSVTLPRPHAVVTVGLPITGDIETLDIDTANAETLAGKKPNIGKVILQLEQTRGLHVGTGAPEGDDNLEGLVELKVRQYESMNSPTGLQTGKAEVIVNSNWNTNGRIFIRQTDPLPASVLAIFPDGHVPVRQG